MGRSSKLADGRRYRNALRHDDAERLAKIFLKFNSFGRSKRKLRRSWCLSIKTSRALDPLRKAYADGYGFKTLAKEIGITYSVIRTAFDMFELPKRTGQNVVTQRLREMRSANVTGDANPWFNWTTNRPDMHAGLHKATGRNGWWKDANGRVIYLRSTFEYAIARYLDEHNYIWDVETVRFKTPYGMYTPDFVVFKQDGTLLILEVKGTFNNDLYMRKSVWFKDFVTNNLPCVRFVIINKIDKFIAGQNYKSLLDEWDNCRLSIRSL